MTGSPGPSRPNILLLVADQHRYDVVGAYGDPYAITPTMDRLAEEGVLFENCYVQNPICSPSRASFATGLYPRNHGLWANGVELPQSHMMVSKALAEAGYDCGMAGKQHLAACSGADEPRRDDGYRVYKWSHDPIHHSENNAYHRWLERNHPDVYQSHVLAQADQPAEAGNVAKGATPMDVLPVESHYTHWIAQEAIDFITDEQRPDDQPFYFMANFFDPHHPFGAPEEFRRLYDADALPGPHGDRAELAGKPGVQSEYSDKSYAGHAPGFIEYTETELREARASYYAMVSFIDAEIRRVLGVLEERGELENTLVIYTSDHGELLGDHAIMLKGPMLYDALMRVPLIMRMPALLQQGSRVEALVQSMDITQTLLEVAGATDRMQTQGESLLNLAAKNADGAAEWRPWALAEYRDSGHGSTPPVHTTMLRWQEHKLVHWHGAPASQRSRDGELYDLSRDPHELVNLYHDPEYAELRELMKDRLLDVVCATEWPRPERIAAW